MYCIYYSRRDGRREEEENPGRGRGLKERVRGTRNKGGGKVDGHSGRASRKGHEGQTFSFFATQAGYLLLIYKCKILIEY